ncbi:MAG TPA: prephenate dehydratase domain-containing protein [Candidatus Saccharimonadales bacterium]|nr:prephenate dehydratase domain-containing protein [Candidatus Saccharimonadales bacterium]
MKVAIQGQPASFHDQAARLFFGGQKIATIGFDTFTETFDALAAKQADYAVVAVENSIHGAINESYDLLDAHHLWIAGEQYLHIEQCLVGLPGATPEDITDVYTHFAALSQCREYLDQHLPRAARHVHPDTAGAVADIKAWQNPHNAAIASAFAAAHYKLPVLADHIETNHHNYTRFALLSRTHHIPPNASKTTLLLQFQSHTGALHEVLGIFAKHQLNLSMLISRPIIGKPGKYQFYIDIDASAARPDFTQAVEEITRLGCVIRILGSYAPHNTLEELADL